MAARPAAVALMAGRGGSRPAPAGGVRGASDPTPTGARGGSGEAAH
jgi:hypothetical protein